MSETRADFWIEGPVGGGIWWVCRTGIGRSKMFQSKREAEVCLEGVFRKLDTGSDACYSLDMDIENTPKNTQVLGLAVGPGYMNQPRDLIGEVAQSATGNAVLRIGREITSGEPGWTRVAHVVLTPDERDDLIAELIAQREGQQ